MGFQAPVSRGQSATASKAHAALRILSYNIHHANPPSRGGLIDLDAIARVIQNADADLVALQEVDKNTRRSGGVDQAKTIAEKTGMYYHFFKAIDHEGGEYGLAILSKQPLKQTKLVRLPQEMKAEERILAYAELKINGKKLVFANTHLDAYTAQNRVVQMQHIVEVFKKLKTPVILCGDLNSTAGTDPINLLDQHFQRSCTSDCPGTIPALKPRKTIDFVALKNADWKVVSHEALAETYASDHRPVLVQYAMP